MAEIDSNHLSHAMKFLRDADLENEPMLTWIDTAQRRNPKSRLCECERPETEPESFLPQTRSLCEKDGTGAHIRSFPRTWMQEIRYLVQVPVHPRWTQSCLAHLTNSQKPTGSAGDPSVLSSVERFQSVRSLLTGCSLLYFPTGPERSVPFLLGPGRMSRKRASNVLCLWHRLWESSETSSLELIRSHTRIDLNH